MWFVSGNELPSTFYDLAKEVFVYSNSLCNSRTESEAATCGVARF